MSIVILVATGCLALLGVFRSYLGERFALTRGRHAVWAVLLLGALAWLTVVAEPALLARPAALLGATLLAAIGGMHLVWAFGLRWGSVAAVPEHAGAALFVPGRAITLVVAGAFSARPGCCWR